MPMTIFTYSTKNKKKLVDFIDQEMQLITDYISLYSNDNSNKYLMNYSKSLFVISNKKNTDDDTLILN